MTEKNRKKLEAKKQRGLSGFNTGTIIHKDMRHPSRQQRKLDTRRLILNA